MPRYFTARKAQQKHWGLRKGQGRSLLSAGHLDLEQKTPEFLYLLLIFFISWPGEMTWNSRSIARHFNAATESIRRAVRPKSQSLRVYYPYDNETYLSHIARENALRALAAL